MPLTFLVFSLAYNIHRHYQNWRSARHRLDPYCLRLPTTKDAALLRRSLVLLVLILLEISCWAFLFAWRLESAILERGQGSSKCGTSLYQVVDPGIALIPRVSFIVTRQGFNILYVSVVVLYAHLGHQIIYYTN